MVSIANVTFPVWQAIILILLSSGALIIALYCLLFMVPLKKFVQRIESLGGGMEGIKKHLNGVETYLEKELHRMESSQSDRIDCIKTETEKRVNAAEQHSHDVSNTIADIENKYETLNESMEGLKSQQAGDAAKLENIEGRIRELQRDMSVLAEETEGKLKKEAREAFAELEATILSTLEVLRDELISTRKNNSITRDQGAPFQSATSNKSSIDNGKRDREESKIISAGPLFSRSDSSQKRTGGENSDDKGDSSDK